MNKGVVAGCACRRTVDRQRDSQNVPPVRRFAIFTPQPSFLNPDFGCQLSCQRARSSKSTASFFAGAGVQQS